MGPILKAPALTIVLAILAVPVVSAQAIQRAPRAPNYLPVDLGVVPGWTRSRAMDVNDARQVVGSMSGSGAETMAFVWLPRPGLGLPAGMSALGTMPLGNSNGSWSSAIDDCGRIIGVATGNTAPLPTTTRAFLWQDGVMRDLGSLVGSSSGATAMNRRGFVVGWSYIGPSTLRAFSTRVDCGDRPSGDLADLGSLAGSWSSANAVNDKGQVVGQSSFRLPSGSIVGVPYYHDASGRSLALPLLPGTTSGYARAISERGVVVGSCMRAQPGAVTERAALWRRTGEAWSISDLGPFAGWTRIEAAAIDEHELVFGSGSVNGTEWRAYLWVEGVFHALDDLLVTSEAVRIVRVGGMNRRGDIAAEGYDAQGQYRAFLLLRVR